MDRYRSFSHLKKYRFFHNDMHVCIFRWEDFLTSDLGRDELIADNTAPEFTGVSRFYRKGSVIEATGDAVQ